MAEPTQERREPATQVKGRLSRLILTGFMGAGKSTVGALLAEALGWRFLDLDSVIEASCAKSVAGIFRDHGEAYFRAKEREAIEKLNDQEKVVMALGGGAVEDADVLAALLGSRESCLVFLDAPLPELLARLKDMDKNMDSKDSDTGPARPLLAAPEELEPRHRRRLPHYRAAHITVRTTALTPREVAARVLERVSQEWLIEERAAGAHDKLS